jgi:RNA polymerase sigma factor (sigma-70 family)
VLEDFSDSFALMTQALTAERSAQPPCVSWADPFSRSACKARNPFDGGIMADSTSDDRDLRLPEDPTSEPGAGGNFPNTRWSLVLATRGGEGNRAQEALAELCRSYWYPLYAYARRRGLSPHDAEDRTQDLFRSLIEHRSLQSVSPENGRLRSYLLTSMKNAIAKVYRSQMTAKRGGGEVVASIDQELAEQRLANEPSHDQSPDVLYDRLWAYTVLEGAMKELESWYAGMKRLDLFQSIRGFIASNQGESSYREVAAELRVNEPALRAAVGQMRKRYRAMIEAQIRETVSSQADAAAELKHLQEVLATSGSTSP